MTWVGRAALFLLILAIVLLLVTLTNGEYRNIARHFLSNLFRQMF